MTTEQVDPLELCRQVAEIIGPSSAAQQALNEYQKRKDAGQNPAIAVINGSWIVYEQPGAKSGNGDHQVQDQGSGGAGSGVG